MAEQLAISGDVRLCRDVRRQRQYFVELQYPCRPGGNLTANYKSADRVEHRFCHRQWEASLHSSQYEFRGHIAWPGSGGAAISMALANTSQGAYEFAVLQYDGSGNFRLVEATPEAAP